MAAKRIDAMNFDATLDELEGIVSQMEQGNLPLEDALKQFERGILLVRAGQQKLTQAEQKVQILLGQQDKAELAQFDPNQGEQ
jgi:exodeoxyribonuclease VII small subunit